MRTTASGGAVWSRVGAWLRHAPARVAGVYALLGAIWILGSDRLLSALVSDPATLTRIQTYKGWLFVLASAGVIFALVRSEARAREESVEGAARERDGRERAESRYRMLVEQSIVGVYLYGPDGLRYANPRYAEMLGYSPREMTGLTLDRLVHPDDLERVREHMAWHSNGGAESSRYVYRGLRKEGGVVSVETYGRVVEDDDGLAVLGIAVDVSERKIIEARYQQTQRLEAIGRLAGGIAHDFNNLLTAISGSADLLLREFSGARGARSDLEEIVRTARRGAALTRQLLSFSRSKPGRVMPIRLNRVILDMEGILRRLLDADVQVALELEDGLPNVRADADQVGQIIMNLVVNARDAMPQGGRLTIRTVVPPASLLPPGNRPTDADYVMLAVRDTGEGMTPETSRRIFEPFYTTKPVGKGTGLGLATVYGIVQQCGGLIDFTSELGAGTEFRIFLPVTDMPVPHDEDDSGTLAGAATDRPATILVVEDEDGVRRVAGRILRRAGHAVLEASDSTEARAVMRQHSGTLDLMLCDVVLPGDSGPELVRDLSQERPGLRVLYMSGYTSDEVRRRAQVEGDLPLVEKPFLPEELLRKVQEMLT